ncbi:hypothetical protein BS17DRAFT_383169 [Gyrodon lividus]|nr:hypothetical protein BS17DRAFT_383169 [Gyrodon lividus]
MYGRWSLYTRFGQPLMDSFERFTVQGDDNNVTRIRELGGSQTNRINRCRTRPWGRQPIRLSPSLFPVQTGDPTVFNHRDRGGPCLGPSRYHSAAAPQRNRMLLSSMGDTIVIVTPLASSRAPPWLIMSPVLTPPSSSTWCEFMRFEDSYSRGRTAMSICFLACASVQDRKKKVI